MRAMFLYTGVIRPADPAHASMLELGLTLYRGPSPEPVLRLDDRARRSAALHERAWIAAGKPERDFTTQTSSNRRNR